MESVSPLQENLKNSLQISYLKREKCPICFDLVEKSKYQLSSSPPAESISIEQHGKFLSGYTNKRVFFSYHRCTTCQLLYCPIYFTQEQLNFLYKSQSENMGEVPLHARFLTQKSYYNILQKFHKHTGDYLEIGADIGLFAQFFAKNENTKHLYLYEPNYEVHDILQKNMGNKPFKIITHNYTAKDIPEGTLGTASIIHALDHILDPRQFIRDIYKSLKPEGVILIVTHNEGSLLAKILKNKWPPYTLQHPQLFRPKTIGKLLTAENFKILTCQRTHNYFPITHFIKAGLSAFGLDKIRVPDLSKFILPIKLGNIITIAKKPAE